MNKKKLLLFIFLIIVILFILLNIWNIFYPYIFPIDKDKAIFENIFELNIIPDDNAYQIALKATNWVKNTTNMWDSIETKYIIGIPYNYCIYNKSGLCLVKKNNDYKLVYFIRSSDLKRIYYFMKSKKGLCGEGSVYLMKIMNHFNYNVRLVKINNWDHVWVEFFDEHNKKYFVDPYMGVITNDFIEFKTKINWIPWDNENKFIAIDINWNKIDISEEYLVDLIK